MRVRAAMLALGWCLASVEAQDAEPEPAADLDFLEYLGTWAEEDDEWLAIEEWQKDDGTEPDGNAKGSEAERDDDDESDDDSD
jgi:hypothetical protein